MTPTALFNPAPFGAGPAIVLTAIAFQSVITPGSAAAGGWSADAGSAAVNDAPTTSAASKAAKPIRLLPLLRPIIAIHSSFAGIGQRAAVLSANLAKRILRAGG